MPELKIIYPSGHHRDGGLYDEPICAALRALVGFTVEITTVDEPRIFMDVTEVVAAEETLSVVGLVPGEDDRWHRRRVPISTIKTVTVP